MTEAPTPTRDEAMARLTELVLDHLAIPRPGRSKHIDELQDTLLPAFMATARQAWLATNPMLQPNDPTYAYLHNATEVQPEQIRTLDAILEELGIHDLLRDIAASPDAATLDRLPVDPYEIRLLRAAGYPDPSAAILALLRGVAQEPGMLTAPSKQLETAAQTTLKVHGDITIIINEPQRDAPNKPKWRKLVTGLSELFSGCVMLAGNAIVIPTVSRGNITALPVLASLTGGITAVGEGVGQLLREGE